MPAPTAAVKNVFKIIKERNIRFVDFRFTDTNGVWHHITTSTSMLEEDTFTEGLNFDGSSIAGWCAINKSDMLYVPDATSVHVDPFTAHPTIVLICDIVDPTNGKVYNRDPRGVARRAEEYLKSTGIADKAFMGPELEFFVFNDVRYRTAINEGFYRVDTPSGAWNSGAEMDGGNTGHTPMVKGGYFKLSPMDQLQDMRSEMLEVATGVGLPARLHHPEVATAGQCELGVDANTPVRKADEVQMLKHVIRNVANTYGRTVTFMPKPLAGDNGSGMHVHQSLWKGDKPLFAGNDYVGLSKMALYYIGGIIKHAKAINAFTNPLTNSYKRLIPGYEAPVILAYASRNRSASIRIPASNSAKAKRIEVRFPDPGANPYLGFAAMLMAGIDGIRNKIEPGPAMEDDLYELQEKKPGKLKQVCGSLSEALEALDKDRAFLTAGGVFDDDMIDAYIALKQQDVIRLDHTPHPVEFEMYYSV